MVKTLTIECPHCQKTFEVLLSSNASMLILNCPTCAAPLIYYKKRCFELSSGQIDKIRKSRQDTTVLKILHSISRQHSETTCSSGPTRQLRRKAGAESLCALPATFMPCADYITRDDIINLRIELETCVDSKQFIEKI
jgi:endogenous inhibitor of DNA gyrase (YacG/DUF329 family)